MMVSSAEVIIMYDRRSRVQPAAALGSRGSSCTRSGIPRMRARSLSGSAATSSLNTDITSLR